MFSGLGPIEIDCDAPAYFVVETCEGLGFQSPLDVRWCRMIHFLEDRRERGGVFGFHSLLWLFGCSPPPPQPITCSCGQPLPLMKCCTFRFALGKEGHFLLGQCCRCCTIFWDESPVLSRKQTESGS